MERTSKTYQAYVQILKEELIPAMGCTEPIAIAYAAAKAREVLGCQPDKVEIGVSNNIIKNVKSVIVPNTDGMKGIEAAAAAGIVGGRADKALEVIADVTDEQMERISTSVKAMSSCSVDQAKGTILENSASGLSEVGTRQGRLVSCLIIPQGKDNITLDVSLDGTVQSLGIPDYTQDGSPVSMLEGGKCLTVRVKVSSGKISMDGVQIEGWGQQGTVEGEIEL